MQLESIQPLPTSIPLTGPIQSPPEIRLESAGPVGPWNRWSYAPAAPKLLMRCNAADRVTMLLSADGIVQQWQDPFAALRWLARFRGELSPSAAPFNAGWIGWISYDFGHLFESIQSRAKDDLTLPLFEFTYHDKIAVIDRVKIETASPSPTTPGVQASACMSSTSCMSSTFTRQEFEHAVNRCINYIRAGDVFQVNLSQRFTAPLRQSPREIYSRLQQQSGAFYGAYLGYEDHALICNSPELFLRVKPDAKTGKRHIITRPIKGTRPHQPGMDRQLRDSAKDQAELNMIVDLERNDLGRICEIGSVRVTRPRDIEAHAGVFHGVATIEGLLRDDVDLVELLRATFPGGSITGAPKIRAMQIIDELEPVRRGPYCGAIGFIGNDGQIEFNIAIRTMIAANGQVHIPVGAGIVADSNPAAEYEETLVKAQAMFAALGIDQQK